MATKIQIEVYKRADELTKNLYPMWHEMMTMIRDAAEPGQYQIISNLLCNSIAYQFLTESEVRESEDGSKNS